MITGKKTEATIRFSYLLIICFNVFDFIYSQATDRADSSSNSSSGGVNNSKPAGKREQKRRPKPRDGTVLFCGVCGDRALGYNFDAISCESCKAFFRRNALKTKVRNMRKFSNCERSAETVEIAWIRYVDLDVFRQSLIGEIFLLKANKVAMYSSWVRHSGIDCLHLSGNTKMKCDDFWA